MEKKFEAKFQIGKAGLSDAFIETLKLAFKTHHQVRISILKSAAEERKAIESIASEIRSKLGVSVAVRIIGFTIILVKIKKPKK